MKWRIAAAAALLLLPFAVACGDDDDDDGSDASSPESEQTTAAATTTPQDPLDAYAAIEVPAGQPDGQRLGDPDAPVTLTMYEDFQCPFCLVMNLRFEEILVEDYVAAGEVLLEFKHYPILGDESVAAAVAGVCAAEQNVFWELHNRLFLEQARAGQLTDEQLNVGRFSDENLREYAVDAGADGAEFDVCYTDAASLQLVQEQFTEARNLGLRGTPSFLLNGASVSVPRDEAGLRELLDGAIEAE